MLAACLPCRYRPGLPLVLRGVSFKAEARDKVGARGPCVCFVRHEGHAFGTARHDMRLERGMAENAGGGRMGGLDGVRNMPAVYIRGTDT